MPHDGPTNCSFPPFSDDPAFNLDSFLALYSRFSWQWDFKDPDCESRHSSSEFLAEQGVQFAV